MSKFLLTLFVFFNIFALWGLDLPISQIADDSLLRITLKDNWFIESPAKVLAQRPVIQQLPNGERVRIYAEEGNTEIGIYLAREQTRGRIATETQAAVQRTPTGRFPGWAQGSWGLTRRKDTGEPVRIRIFLRSDQNTYIDFRPLNNERVYMDAVVYGGFVVRSLPLPIPFERLYTMPLNDVLRLAGNRFPYKYFEPNPELYRYQRNFVAQVRSRLNEVRYENNDGAIDENGNYVFIETLQPQPANPGHVNCSGFVKWLIDGCLSPITGERLSIAPLKEPFGNRGSSFSERYENFVRVWESEERNFEGNRRGENFTGVNDQLINRSLPLAQRRDPYFGLDWIRNLAAAANGALRSPDPKNPNTAFGNLEEFEVRNNNFASVSVNVNRTFVIHSYPGFLPDAGFGIEGLNALLYTLAIDEPFVFYLAAVNNEIGEPTTPQNLRGAPRLRQFFHVLAFVPYFDEFGEFKIALFESAGENSFSNFRARYRQRSPSDDPRFVNLVKIPVPARFEP